LVDEAEYYISEIVMKEAMLAGLPIFLFGISMGGATAIKLAHRAPDRYAGMVTFAPMCSLEKVRKASIFHCIQNRHVEFLIGFLACVNPKLPLAKTTPNTMFPAMTKEYDDDPLCYQLATRIVVAKSFIDTTAEFMNTDFFNGLRTPSATFHSVHDTLTDMEGTEALFSGSVNVPDKTFYRVGAGLDVDVKMWHNLLREPGSDMVLNKAMEWMNQRCPGKSVKKESVK
jgi:alpha-beta hydrolase superfamily lysophospholipase